MQLLTMKKIAPLFMFILFLSACAAKTPVALNKENYALLKGEWNGTWASELGQSGPVRLIVENIDESGQITGSRTAVSPNAADYGTLPTYGSVRDGILVLEGESFRLQLESDEKGAEHYLSGSYRVSTQAGRNVTGSMSFKKAK